ncbi:flavonoid 3',5'-methyltransferase-like isoform X2 [Spinacia oleracea]|uniref:Flavonoid 3',5'-methyltransferase-like isoform X2 n=1 Tax=Spinacia oleracea TaxID=3562 RepID=A0A9R0J482_SPIOL|nr:flavonoid 3',5'-methyltransferase-like isoform X2 [Spinacia oleracea]
MAIDLKDKMILSSPALREYILETSAYPNEHQQLKEIRDATVDKYKHMSIMNASADEAQFLSLLLKLINAKNTLEIGVFTGYSLLTTALALPDDGKGKEGIFDFAFVDADKENYIKYHEPLLKLVKVGGVIAYDNTLWFGSVAFDPNDEIFKNDPAMKLIKQIGYEEIRHLNGFLANDPRIESTLLSVGDGLTLCRRKY